METLFIRHYAKYKDSRKGKSPEYTPQDPQCKAKRYLEGLHQGIQEACCRKPNGGRRKAAFHGLQETRQGRQDQYHQEEQGKPAEVTTFKEGQYSCQIKKSFV